MTRTQVSEIDIAWAAGLFEGEGCINVTLKPRLQRRLALNMVDRDVVERFCAIVGVGQVTLKPRQEDHWQDQWLWRVSNWNDITHVLDLLAPYLGQRRSERADEMRANPPTRKVAA